MPAEKQIPEKNRKSPRTSPPRKKSKKRKQRLTPGMLGVLVGILLFVALYFVFFAPPKADPPVNVIVEYEDLIQKYATENGLAPTYVSAVIMAESGYDPNAVSSVNAQGLMQLLPETGEWIAGKFNETYSEGCLFNPDTNLRYGCWYLGWLYRRYNGDMRCASSAYHQGQGTVDKWLKNPNYSQNGVTLTTIPSDVTGSYVTRILKYYKRYEEIYAEKNSAETAA